VMCASMREHINEEEAVIPPILKERFTEEEGLAIVSKIVPSRGSDNLYLLPSEIRNQFRIGGDDSVNYLMNLVPAPLRWHWRKFSSTWYEPENRDYINSLTRDTDIEPKLPKARGFGWFRWY